VCGEDEQAKLGVAAVGEKPTLVYSVLVGLTVVITMGARALESSGVAAVGEKPTLVHSVLVGLTVVVTMGANALESSSRIQGA